MDDEELIYEAQQYPLLYDCKLNDYKDILKKDNALSSTETFTF